MYQGINGQSLSLRKNKNGTVKPRTVLPGGNYKILNF